MLPSRRCAWRQLGLLGRFPRTDLLTLLWLRGLLWERAGDRARPPRPAPRAGGPAESGRPRRPGAVEILAALARVSDNEM